MPLFSMEMTCNGDGEPFRYVLQLRRACAMPVLLIASRKANAHVLADHHAYQSLILSSSTPCGVRSERRVSLLARTRSW